MLDPHAHGGGALVFLLAGACLAALIPAPSVQAVSAVHTTTAAIVPEVNRRHRSARRDFAYGRPSTPVSPPQRRRARRRPVRPAAPRPLPADRDRVQWFDEYNFFGLGTIGEQSLRIRQAPVGAEGEPWPLPQRYFSGSAALQLADTLTLAATTHGPCPVLDAAWERVRHNVYRTVGRSRRPSAAQPPQLGRLASIKVTVTKCERLPTHRMQESYNLAVKRSGVTIWAPEVWGALRALETFSQLVYRDPYSRLVVNVTEIFDFPTYPHRGVLIDTSRHYITKKVLLQNLEAMAQNKMNVFHWHIVDDNSFPYQSKVLPNLTRFGAFNARTHVYTHEDIREILEEATLRGIRVIPEFDTPGHSFSWGMGQDYLLTPCYDQMERPTTYYGPINPILKSTYRFLKTLFTEVTDVFIDPYIHLGGDEVPYECWLSNPYIKRFMERNSYDDIKEVLNLYENRLLEIIAGIRGRQKRPDTGTIVWQEVFDDGVKLQRNTVVQIWKGDIYDIERVLLAGHKVIFSTGWYLDYLNYGEDWDKYYNNDMLLVSSSMFDSEEGGSINSLKHVNRTNLLGGEACLWMEYADSANVISRLWPRASAVAERLWSSQAVNDAVKAAPRMEAHRCRMLSRGLPVGVASGPGHCNTPPADTDDSWTLRRLLPAGRPAGPGRVAPPAYRDARFSLLQISLSDAVYLMPLLLAAAVCVAVLLAALLRRLSCEPAAARPTCRLAVVPRSSLRRLSVLVLAFTAVWCVCAAPIWMHYGHHRGAAGAGTTAVH